MLTIPPRSEAPDGTAYVEAGAGEPVVLIHGVGMRIEAWGPQIAHLSRHHRVIAVDMPGHGGTKRLPSGSGLDAFVAWIAEFLGALGLASVNLAGHSMGALVSGGLVATRPDLVRRIALLNGVHRRDPAARAAVMHRAAQIAAGDLDIEGPIQRWFEGDDIDPEAIRLVRWCLENVDPQGYATAYAAFAGGDSLYADVWPKVTVPAAFITGINDPNSTPAMARAMAQLAPRGRATVVDGHRHMVNLTAPHDINHILDGWLATPLEDAA